jgi:AraC-like DNA-binding protein
LLPKIYPHFSKFLQTPYKPFFDHHHSAVIFVESMVFNTFPAPAYLAEYVRFFWILESNEPATFPFIHRATAECCPEFIFYFKGEVKVFTSEDNAEKTFASGIYAQSRDFRKFAIEKEFGMLGVYLYPQTIPLLFDIPANKLTDYNLDIASVFGNEGSMLEDRVMCAATHPHRIELISDFLRKKLVQPQKRSSYLSATIRNAISTGMTPSVREMASTCNLSIRQIERDFQSLSGFSPRLFSKLTRFRALMENFPAKSNSMADLAYEFNYYDQSHFINDFKRFTGLSPMQYIKDREGVENERMTPETNTDR